MRKRQKTTREEVALVPDDVIARPPTAPTDYVPPPPSAILDRLSAAAAATAAPTAPIRALGSGIAAGGIEMSAVPSAQRTDVLSRLKAISRGDSLPVPRALPIASSAGRIGTETDDSAAPQTERADSGSAVAYDRPIGFGIGAALEFISRNGILVEHRGDDEQILEYRDSNGNLVNGKAAFKYQSHIFSGKAPGLKYRKKREERIRAEERKRVFQIGDTPLHAASSLRAALGERQQAFLELSGDQRGVMPYEPSKEEVKDTSLRRKRLKLRNKQKLKKEVHIKVLK